MSIYLDEPNKKLKKEREDIDNIYYQFLSKKGIKSYIVEYIDLSINDENRFKESLKIFKLAFNSSNRELKIALWNHLYISDDFDITTLKEHLTSDEYAFIEDYIKSSMNTKIYQRDSKNINEIFENTIVKLVPFQKDRKTFNKDIQAYIKHLKEDGDYESYALYNLPDDSKDVSPINIENLSFFIYSKKTNKIIGFIALGKCSVIYENIEYDDEKVEVAFYIFKDNRRNGYCLSALNLLCDLAFKNKLKIVNKTVRVNKYETVNTNIDLISTFTLTSNKSCIQVLNKAGFKKQGTMHKYCKIHDQYVDVDYYELAK